MVRRVARLFSCLFSALLLFSWVGCCAAAKTESVLVDEYSMHSMQLTVRALLGEEMRVHDKKIADMDKQMEKQRAEAKAETEKLQLQFEQQRAEAKAAAEKHRAEAEKQRAEMEQRHSQELRDQRQEFREALAAVQQTVFEVSAAASAAPSGTGAKEYNKLRRIIDEQGGHIEVAMDGVESVANKVEVLDAEVKDVWRKFPPAFEDMRKKQGGL